MFLKCLDTIFNLLQLLKFDLGMWRRSISTSLGKFYWKFGTLN